MMSMISYIEVLVARNDFVLPTGLGTGQISLS